MLSAKIGSTRQLKGAKRTVKCGIIVACQMEEVSNFLGLEVWSFSSELKMSEQTLLDAWLLLLATLQLHDFMTSCDNILWTIKHNFYVKHTVASPLSLPICKDLGRENWITVKESTG